MCVLVFITSRIREVPKNCKYFSRTNINRLFFVAPNPTVAIVAGMISGVLVIACVLVVVFLKRKEKAYASYISYKSN